MKAILSKTEFPKFLRNNGNVTKNWSWNKFLSIPWVPGEIVKIASMEEQKPNNKYDNTFKYCKPYTLKQWRKLFVKVIRRDKNGKFTIKQTAEWIQFEKLNKKI
jgi:hypothetical protein